MSMCIAICDDERSVREELENKLSGIFERLNVSYEIDSYASGDELCAKIEKGNHYSMIFLDIEFAGAKSNGIDIGKQIRDMNVSDEISIVYISWETMYSMELFDIRPLNFLVKPLLTEKIEYVIKTYLRLSGLWVNDFVYKIRRDTFRVKIKDIVYMESMKRKLTLHLADGRKEEFYGTLKEVYQEQLHKFDFLFIHGSYVVNFDYVSALKPDMITLGHGGITLPVSKLKKKEVKANYFSIMERRGVV